VAETGPKERKKCVQKMNAAAWQTQMKSEKLIFYLIIPNKVYLFFLKNNTSDTSC
jgi:hypothetical protein